MSEITLESLARRLAEVERRLNEKQSAVIPPTRDWRSVVGISEETEFSRLMQAEMDALHEADRRAAETEDCE
jgi:deoxycytidylate deaminase